MIGQCEIAAETRAQLMKLEGIWSGRIVYSAMNARALIADVS